jgi:hypothetical protein
LTGPVEGTRSDWPRPAFQRHEVRGHRAVPRLPSGGGPDVAKHPDQSGDQSTPQRRGHSTGDDPGGYWIGIPGLRRSLGIPRPGLVWRRERNQNDTEASRKSGYIEETRQNAAAARRRFSSDRQSICFERTSVAMSAVSSMRRRSASRQSSASNCRQGANSALLPRIFPDQRGMRPKPDQAPSMPRGILCRVTAFAMQGRPESRAK